MPDIRRRGGDEEREILFTKAAGSAAAFALLVMWMTPPTTPHPAAPSPLLAFKTMHSDAPTLAAAVGVFAAPADAAVATIPWWGPRAPQAAPPRDEPAAIATAPTEVVMSDEATDDAPSDAQDIVQSPPTGRPPVALARAGTTPQAAQPRYPPRTETMSARPADDGQVQEAAAEAGE